MVCVGLQPYAACTSKVYQTDTYVNEKMWAMRARQNVEIRRKPEPEIYRETKASFAVDEMYKSALFINIKFI